MKSMKSFAAKVLGNVIHSLHEISKKPKGSFCGKSLKSAMCNTWLDEAATRRNRGLGRYGLIFTNTLTGTLA